MKQYFLANMILEERKVPLLITCMGKQAYIMLKDLCDPITPAKSTYGQLCNILSRQFAPKISIYRKRKEFYTLRTNAQESVNDWYMKIKNAATQCQFGSNLIAVLKDKFVTGFNDDIIKGVDNLVADSLSRLVSETNDNVQKYENSDVLGKLG